MERRNLLIAGAAVVAAGGTGAFILGQPAPVEAQQTTGDATRMLGQPNDFGVTEMTMGDPDAPIEIIEYASFTCPHCATFHKNVFPQLKENYIDTGKVYFGYREVYFDRPGLWASMVARCGGPLRFFSVVDMIYDKQSEWVASGDPAVIANELAKLGKIAGLDQETLDVCMSDGETAQNLNAWFQSNADRDGIRSTPTLLIDGESVENQRYDALAALLDAKLAADQ